MADNFIIGKKTCFDDVINERLGVGVGKSLSYIKSTSAATGVKPLPPKSGGGTSLLLSAKNDLIKKRTDSVELALGY